MDSIENKGMTEEEKKHFATGASLNAPAENKAAGEPVTELNNEIEEFCPDRLVIRKDNADYGEYKHVEYYSATCKMRRGFSVLLPAEFDNDKKYPVMYLLHGIFGNEFSYSHDEGNKVQEMIGNMTVEGTIGPMIVICPNMYATDDPAMEPGFTAESCLPYDNFINELTNDVMPYVEENYPILRGRDNTYLAGFSMGGREAIYIALRRPELFGYVAAMAPAPGIIKTTDMYMTHPGMLDESEVKFKGGALTPDEFIICCGTIDSVVGKYPESYHILLKKNGAPHTWYPITGHDHDSDVIRSGIYNLLKRAAHNRKTQ